MSASTVEVEARGLWISYAGLVTVGYLTYGLGAAAPHLRSHLGLSNAEVGLHSSALAVGLVVAGILVADLGCRFGERTVRGAAIAVLGIALLLLAAAPTVEATLAAGALIGFGAGTLLGYAYATLGAPGGKPARVRLARGAAAAIARAPAQAALAGTRLTLATGVAILVAPFLLGTAADATGVVPAWGLVLGLVVVAIALVLGLSDEPTTQRSAADINITTEAQK